MGFNNKVGWKMHTMRLVHIPVSRPAHHGDHGDHGAGTGRRSPTTLRKISTIEKGYINEYAVFHILFNYYLHYLLFL